MNDLQATIQQILDYVRGIWIKKRFIIISTWLICPIGLLYVANMPDVYESKAKVYADTRSMLKPLLRGLTFQTNPEDEIKLIANTLKSTPNLEDIARKADLDIQAATPGEFNVIVNQLKSGIKISGGGRRSDGMYNVSFEHEDPQMAKRIVSLTLDKFIESSLGQNRQDSDSASKFLEQQITEYSARLESAERRVADFKKEYGEITTGSGSYYQQKGQLESQIEALDLELKEKNTQLESLKSKFKTSTRKNGDPDNINIETQYDARIRQLQANLDDLLIRFTDRHPDVIQTQERLQSLKEERRAEIEQLMAGLSSGELAAGSLSENAIVQELTIVINNLESHVASLKVRRQNFVEKLAELEQKIELIPDIEAKRTALNRDYGIVKRKYEEFLTRKEQSDLSRKADLSAEDIKFRIIEPPVVPTSASGPKRPIFYTAVLIISIAAGGVLAFLFSQLNPVITSGSQLASITGRPILGAVTDINVVQVKKRNRRRLFVFMLSTGTIVGIYLVFMITEIGMRTTPIKLLEAYL